MKPGDYSKRALAGGFLFGFLVIVLWPQASLAGSLGGTLRDAATGQAVRRAMVRAYAHGRSTAVEAMTENDGSFLLEDLPAGKYAVCAGSIEGRRPVCAPEVEIGAEGLKRLDLKAGQSFAIIGDSWLQGRDSFAQSSICEDNDSLRTDYSLAGAGRMHRAVSAGQSFAALSESITFASACLTGIDSAPGYVRFSIHEGGLGGKQIGPSKAVAPNNDCAVAWGPDEVVVQPGATYYLHIESLSGKEFLTACMGDTYTSGNAAFNGRETRDKDIVAAIAGQITDADFDKLMKHPASLETILLSSPSFENGLGKWRKDAPCGEIVGCDGGVVPYRGTRMFGWANEGKGEGTRAVIYQKVKVQKGEWYVFSGFVYTDHRGGRSSDVKIRLVVLPQGQDAVRDNGLIETSQWYATEGRWRRASIQFKARAELVAVGFDLEQRFSLESSSLYVDGAHLQRIGAQ